MTAAELRDGQYWLDGTPYPRVSSILAVINKPFLATWRGKVGNAEADRIAREATDLGTRVHAVCAAALGGPPCDDTDPALAPYVAAVQAWVATEVAEVVACERVLVSRQQGYAGTCDLLVRLRDGALALADFKTSKQLDPGYALQLAAYRRALWEDGLLPRRRLVLWLPKAEPGRLVVQDYPAHAQDDVAWMATLQLWRWQQRTRAAESRLLGER
jgi:hypothetical protein